MHCSSNMGTEAADGHGAPECVWGSCSQGGQGVQRPAVGVHPKMATVLHPPVSLKGKAEFEAFGEKQVLHPHWLYWLVSSTGLRGTPFPGPCSHSARLPFVQGGLPSVSVK